VIASGRVVHREVSAWDIFVINADGSQLERLTPGVRLHSDDPTGWPDGRWIALAGNGRAPVFDIHVMRADGSDVVPLNRFATEWADSPSWGKR
jgi:Tol biopolymer transport system component